MLFDHIKSVNIIPRRWRVDIYLQFEDGSHQMFIASADNSLTDGNNIWFGTKEEYEENTKDLW